MENGVKIGMSPVTTVVFVMGLGMIVLIKEEKSVTPTPTALE